MSIGFNPTGGEFLVNTETADAQTAPSVTVLSDGSYVVVWQSLGQDGSSYGIFGQRLDATGAPVGIEFQINTYTDSLQRDATVVALSTGGFVVGWESFGQDGDQRGVYGQLFNASGSPVGGEFRFNTETTGNQYEPQIAALADGGFIVTWPSDKQDGDAFGIFAQRYDVNGNPVGPEFQVNTTTDGFQATPSVIGLPDGGFIISWKSQNEGDEAAGIYAQRYTSNGTPVGGEFRLSTDVANDQQVAQMVILADGGLLVVWESSGQDGAAAGIYGQRFDTSGAPVGGEFLVNTTTTGSQEEPALVALPDGGFVVVWMSRDLVGGGWDVYGQRYDAAGQPVGGELQINDVTAGTQYYPSIAVSDDGSFLVTWASENQDGDALGVVGQHFEARWFGTAAADVISDSVGADWIDGQGGDDTISAGTGSDVVFGGAGDDVLRGGGGFDTIEGGIGNDTILGGAQADFLEGGDGDDQMAGEDGADNLLGGAGNDRMTGDAGNDRLFGGDGADVLRGGTQDDRLLGEAGNDRLFGDGGFDHLDGGDGNDVLAGGGQADNLYGRLGDDTLSGDDGADRLFAGAGNDVANGGDGNDVIFAGQGDDTVLGGTGDDRLFAGAGDDVVNGGLGNDALTGGVGFDTLNGGAGDDTLTGSFNADTFVFAGAFGADVITDFAATNDFERINLALVASITDFADLMANHMSQVGSDVVIDAGGGNTITLEGVSLADLDAVDFVF